MEHINRKSLILLYSGGLDSTVLLHMALADSKDVHCIGFDYGQRHVRELETAAKNCMELNVSYQEVKLPNFGLRSQLTDGAEAPHEGVSEWHVPGRNLMFLSIAASIAENRGTNLIWFGANFADRENRFPDCYQEWVYQVNKILQINGSIPLQLEAPLLGMSKELIEEIASTYKVNLEEVHSGYEV